MRLKTLKTQILNRLKLLKVQINNTNNNQLFNNLIELKINEDPKLKLLKKKRNRYFGVENNYDEMENYSEEYLNDYDECENYNKKRRKSFSYYDEDEEDFNNLYENIMEDENKFNEIRERDYKRKKGDK